jgi:predicted ferric reductase
MALIATIALVLVVALGIARRRLPVAASTWRILHGYLAAVVIVLGFGHAVLTDGALDGAGTAVLLILGGAALLTVAIAFAVRTRA